MARPHAGARVDQHRQTDRLLFGSEKGNLLRSTVLEQREIATSKPADSAALPVGYLDRNRLKIGFGGEHGSALRERCPSEAYEQERTRGCRSNKRLSDLPSNSAYKVEWAHNSLLSRTWIYAAWHA